MKSYTFIFLTSLFLLALFPLVSLSQSSDSTIIKKFVKKTDISGQWFLAYNYDISNSFNQFMLKRGYFTIKTQLNNNISVRYTQDIALDKEGTDAGNVEIRLKYLYMKFNGHKNSVFKNTYAEFGLVRRPFLDFEQKINNYRVQGKMFSEKYDIYNSADFGVTIGGNIGGKINDNDIAILGKSYAGKFGSYSFGIYNGGGYHAMEYNNNKTFEGRISLRPFPFKIPGLQFTYTGVFGQANIPDTNINFNSNLFFISCKNERFTLVTQYFFNNGNYTATYVNEFNQALKNDGFSVYTEVFLSKNVFSLIGRYDYFNINSTPLQSVKSYVGGVSYHFLGSKLVLFYENDYSGRTGINAHFTELVLEIAF